MARLDHLGLEGHVARRCLEPLRRRGERLICRGEHRGRLACRLPGSHGRGIERVCLSHRSGEGGGRRLGLLLRLLPGSLRLADHRRKRVGLPLGLRGRLGVARVLEPLHRPRDDEGIGPRRDRGRRAQLELSSSAAADCHLRQIHAGGKSEDKARDRRGRSFRTRRRPGDLHDRAPAGLDRLSIAESEGHARLLVGRHTHHDPLDEARPDALPLPIRLHERKRVERHPVSGLAGDRLPGDRRPTADGKRPLARRRTGVGRERQVADGTPRPDDDLRRGHPCRQTAGRHRHLAVKTVEPGDDDAHHLPPSLAQQERARRVDRHGHEPEVGLWRTDDEPVDEARIITDLRAALAEKEPVGAVGRRREHQRRIEAPLVELPPAITPRHVVHPGHLTGVVDIRHDRHLRLRGSLGRRLDPLDDQRRIDRGTEPVRPDLDPQPIILLGLERIPIDIAPRIKSPRYLARRRQRLGTRGPVVAVGLADQRRSCHRQKNGIRGAARTIDLHADTIDRKLPRLEPAVEADSPGAVGRESDPQPQLLQGRAVEGHRRRLPPRKGTAEKKDLLVRSGQRRGGEDGRQPGGGGEQQPIGMISPSAVNLVPNLEDVAAIGGERDAEHGVGATVGAGGSDDPPVGSGDRENRPGPRIDLSGEHPDRESLSPLGVDEKAIDIAGRIEGAVDDPRQRDGGRLVVGPIGLRPRQHRKGIDEEGPGR